MADSVRRPIIPAGTSRPARPHHLSQSFLQSDGEAVDRRRSAGDEAGPPGDRPAAAVARRALRGTRDRPLAHVLPLAVPTVVRRHVRRRLRQDYSHSRSVTDSNNCVGPRYCRTRIFAVRVSYVVDDAHRSPLRSFAAASSRALCCCRTRCPWDRQTDGHTNTPFIVSFLYARLIRGPRNNACS